MGGVGSGNFKPRRLNAKGVKYNRLTAVKFVELNKSLHAIWLFKCVCGKRRTALLHLVIKGQIMSCGCLAIETRKRNVLIAMKHRWPLSEKV
jgi:hypothetical protein